MADLLEETDVPKSNCEIPDCQRLASDKGLCNMHRQRVRKTGSPDLKPRAPKLCVLDGCDRKRLAHGLCSLHYQRDKRKGTYELVPPEVRICSEPDCDTVMKAAGLCQKHYTRQWRVGARVNKPAAGMAFREERWSDFIEIVRSRCEIPESGCWAWPGAGRYGYGSIHISTGPNKSRVQTIHRAMMQAVLEGRDISGKVVHHKCANRICCNPEHLQLVTNLDNTAEMLERNHMLKRIDELTKALAEVAPAHPLLVVA